MDSKQCKDPTSNITDTLSGSLNLYDINLRKLSMDDGSYFVVISL